MQKTINVRKDYVLSGDGDAFCVSPRGSDRPPTDATRCVRGVNVGVCLDEGFRSPIFHHPLCVLEQRDMTT